MTAVYTNFCGQIVNQVRDGLNRDIIPDPLGSTAHLVDDTQTKRASYTYTPYGEIESHSGETTPLNFVGTLGYYRDAVNSALTYIRARWYKAMYGRWMTVDPLWPRHPRYSYSLLNPISWRDRSGRVPDSDYFQTKPKCEAYFCWGIPPLYHSTICGKDENGDFCYGSLATGLSGGGFIGENIGGCPEHPVHSGGFTWQGERCRLISTDCCFARAICDCIHLGANEFDYWFRGGCHGYAQNVVDCAWMACAYFGGNGASGVGKSSTHIDYGGPGGGTVGGTFGGPGGVRYH